MNVWQCKHRTFIHSNAVYVGVYGMAFAAMSTTIPTRNCDVKCLKSISFYTARTHTHICRERLKTHCRNKHKSNHF